MDNPLIFALKISGIGIVVLLLVLTVLAGVVSLMTKFIVEKPEKESDSDEEEVAEIEAADSSDKESKLETVAAIALALYRAQTEIQTNESSAPAGEINSWRQFNLQRRLTQSSTIRRSR
jgi:sodium pump decarboxylase gamma subunit